MSLNVTKEDYDSVMASAVDAINELTRDVSGINITVGQGSTDVLTAIKYIFGPSYINPNGTAVITYEMFNKVSESLRTAGKLKVGEYL